MWNFDKENISDNLYYYQNNLSAMRQSFVYRTYNPYQSLVSTFVPNGYQYATFNTTLRQNFKNSHIRDLTEDEKYAFEKDPDLEFAFIVSPKSKHFPNRVVAWSHSRNCQIVLEPVPKPRILVTHDENTGVITVDENLKVEKNETNSNRDLVLASYDLATLITSKEITPELQLALQQHRQEGFEVKRVTKIERMEIDETGQINTTAHQAEVHFYLEGPQGETIVEKTAPLALPAPEEYSDKTVTRYLERPEIARVVNIEYDDKGEAVSQQTKFVPLNEAGKRFLDEKYKQGEELLKNNRITSGNVPGNVLIEPRIVLVNDTNKDDEAKNDTNTDHQVKNESAPVPKTKIVNPDEQFLRDIVSQIRTRRVQLEDQYEDANWFVKFFIKGKLAKAEGLKNILDNMGSYEDHHFKLKDGLTVMKILDIITAAREKHKALNQSFFGAKTVNLLDLIQAQCKVKKAGAYANKAISKRVHELADDQRKGTCFKLYNNRKEAKIEGLSDIFIKDDANADTVQATINKIDKQTATKMRSGIVSHKTADLLHELSNLDKNVQTIEKRSVRKSRVY